MEGLAHKIEQLDGYQIDWKQVEENGYNIGYGEMYAEIWGEVMAEIRARLKKTSYKECCDGWKELTEKYDWFHGVLKYAEASLVYYRNLEALRELDNEGKILAGGFVIQAFENYIVKVNPDFLGSWKQFGMKSGDEMLQVLRALDSLAEFYVSRSLARISVKKDFGDESGLSEEVCELYSELVDKNYMEMKMNLILNKLNASQ